MRILIAGILALAFADDAELVRPLEAKGVKVKKTPAGVVTDVHLGGLKGITIEDYRAIGQCRNLVTLNLSAEDLRFNDEAAAKRRDGRVTICGSSPGRAGDTRNPCHAAFPTLSYLQWIS